MRLAVHENFFAFWLLKSMIVDHSILLLLLGSDDDPTSTGILMMDRLSIFSNSKSRSKSKSKTILKEATMIMKPKQEKM